MFEMSTNASFANKTWLFFTITTTSFTQQSSVINMAIESWFLKWFLIYRKCKSIPLTALSDILTFRSNWTFYNCRSLDDFDFILATKFTIMASHWRFFTFSAYENSLFTTSTFYSISSELTKIIIFFLPVIAG